eukprot:2946467-Prymnesium_polylepis.1
MFTTDTEPRRQSCKASQNLFVWANRLPGRARARASKMERKMSIKELKALLKERGVDASSAVEKDDLIRL